MIYLWMDTCRWLSLSFQFHILLNVAVGGTNGYIPDGAINHSDNAKFGKPWQNGPWYVEAMNQFWEARSRWYWTWGETEEENAAMMVDYIKVYQKHWGTAYGGDCAL